MKIVLVEEINKLPRYKYIELTPEQLNFEKGDKVKWAEAPERTFTFLKSDEKYITCFDEAEMLRYFYPDSIMKIIIKPKRKYVKKKTKRNNSSS